jgi:ubiquinone/menaquinone biosynthesis C-methylase UbiE
MSSDLLLEKIKRHWEDMAQRGVGQDGLRPTARDPHLQEVVETAIAKYLMPESKTLDIGCGDGLSTLRFSGLTKMVVGIDFIEELVKKAQDNAHVLSIKNVNFMTANILDLEQIREKYNLFDTIISIRCLINLPNWDYQSAALSEIARTVRPGGLFITSEGWEEGFAELNVLRQKVNLPIMPLAAYNCLISRARFESEAKQYFEIIDYVNLGLYLFLSRLFQPLFTMPDPPSHIHHMNKVAADIVNAGIVNGAFNQCDYSGVYVLRRK